MNYQKVIHSLCIILVFLGLTMLLPLFWSLYYGDNDWTAFLQGGLFTVAVGYAGIKATRMEGDIKTKEAFIIVSFSWLFASLFGAIPYLLSGTVASFTDGFFETMSGFTTTGATIFSDIERLPHGILFWRSLTQWLGGMGIIVLFVAILSSFGVGGMQLYRAELPGHMTEKIKPRISETAKILWETYLLLTIFETLVLWGLGMSLFDAMCHAFGSVATGGFSTKNASIGYYSNPLIHWAVTLFMFLSGVNLALYYQAFRGRSLKYFWRNSEYRLYAIFVFIGIVILSISVAGDFSSLGETLRQASFHVVALITTTAYTTVNYSEWTVVPQILLVALMFVGGCAGSTAGSIKVGRILLLLKQGKLELQRALHPRAILSIKVDGKPVGQDTVITVAVFFFSYMLIIALGTVVMGMMGLDLLSAFTSVAACLGNVGSGLGLVGPSQNYSFVPSFGKYLLAFVMLLGRLELFTVLVLLLPSFWRR
jgi:trk system potassium uptake protein TrkH